MSDPILKRTEGARKAAKKMASYLREQRPDYQYLIDVFKWLRQELNITPQRKPKKLPRVPTDMEVNRLYEVVWHTQDSKHLILFKIMLYTGVRVSELVNIKLIDIDLKGCQIRIVDGKGAKDRRVPFPTMFKETLALYIDRLRQDDSIYLFESRWRKSYTDRAIRKIVSKYTKAAGIEGGLSPHAFRHYLFTWLKKKGVDDALIQPYSGHENRHTLEVYSRLSLAAAQEKYDDVMGGFPI